MRSAASVRLQASILRGLRHAGVTVRRMLQRLVDNEQHQSKLPMHGEFGPGHAEAIAMAPRSVRHCRVRDSVRRTQASVAACRCCRVKAVASYRALELGPRSAAAITSYSELRVCTVDAEPSVRCKRSDGCTSCRPGCVLTSCDRHASAQFFRTTSISGRSASARGVSGRLDPGRLARHGHPFGSRIGNGGLECSHGPADRFGPSRTGLRFSAGSVGLEHASRRGGLSNDAPRLPLDSRRMPEPTAVALREMRRRLEAARRADRHDRHRGLQQQLARAVQAQLQVVPLRHAIDVPLEQTARSAAATGPTGARSSRAAAGSRYSLPSARPPRSRCGARRPTCARSGTYCRSLPSRIRSTMNCSETRCDTCGPSFSSIRFSISSSGATPPEHV